MNASPSSYASALFALLGSEKEKKAYAEALKSIETLFKQDKEIHLFFSSPDISKQEKLNVLQSSLPSAKELPHLLPFFQVLLEHHRFSSLPEISSSFSSLVNEELGILEGYVYSSSKLTPKQLVALEDAFYKKLGKKAVLKNILDPSLLGGIRVALGGKVYDSSLKGKLDELRLHLHQGGHSL